MKVYEKFTVKRRLPGAALLCLLLIILGWSAAYAQDQPKGRYSVEQLEVLVAPVALFPDDVLSNVLAASPLSTEIVEASMNLKNKGGVVKEMPGSEWDPSVKALLYFPQVLYYMDKNIYWTMDLGAAVVSQLGDVIKAVQNYRKKAYDAKNLKSCEEQDVVIENGIIRIESTDPEVVYVPTYDCSDVIAAGAAGRTLLTFTAGAVTGDWLRYRSCNWNNGSIAVNSQYLGAYNYPAGSASYRALQAKTPGAAWTPSPAAKVQYEKHVASRSQIRPQSNIPAPARAGGRPQSSGGGGYNNYASGGYDYRTGDRLRATAQLNGNVPPPPGSFGAMNSGARTQAQSSRGAASMGGFGGGRR
ncbi:MAG: DUF3300 domain-containing protein [Candidatus Eremiobacteraeota bacterium]|nr:DUF3300 domain-containing protein [Candidatus Eremiobacteraeota bacterium]